MVAAILGQTPSHLHDVPRIRDVEVVSGLLELHGVRVAQGTEPGELVLDPANAERANVDEINVHAGSSRIPILLCGPLLHRLGHAFIPDLGGCHIGDRPIDFHLEALRKFGAAVDNMSVLASVAMTLLCANAARHSPTATCATRFRNRWSLRSTPSTASAERFTASALRSRSGKAR